MTKSSFRLVEYGRGQAVLAGFGAHCECEARVREKTENEMKVLHHTVTGPLSKADEIMPPPISGTYKILTIDVLVDCMIGHPSSLCPIYNDYPSAAAVSGIEISTKSCTHARGQSFLNESATPLTWASQTYLYASPAPQSPRTQKDQIPPSL